MNEPMTALKQSITDIFQTVKTDGVRATFKKHGWRAVALVVGYYLIRDLTLYVLIPGLVIAFA
jgi:hypothetical protein